MLTDFFNIWLFIIILLVVIIGVLYHRYQKQKEDFLFILKNITDSLQRKENLFNKDNKLKNSFYNSSIGILLDDFKKTYLSNIDYENHIDDIIETKKVELREQEKMFRNVFEFAQVGMVLIDKNKKTIEANKVIVSMFGFSPNDFSKSQLDKVFAESETEKESQMFDLLVAGSIHFYNLEKQYNSQNNKTLWFDATMSAVLDDKQIFRYAVLIVLNITKRKEIEHKQRFEIGFSKAISLLAQSVNSNELSIAKLSDMIFRLVLKTTESDFGMVGVLNNETGDLNILAFSSELINIFNIDKRLNYFRKTDGIYTGLLGQALTTEKAFFTNTPSEFSVLNPASEKISILKNFMAVPTIANEKLLGLIVCANKQNKFSIDDLNLVKRIAQIFSVAILRKQFENDLITEKKNANSANKAKSIFLSNISNEIRTPLNQIISYTDALINNNEEKVRITHLNAIKQNGNTLLGLINNILDISALEADNLHIKPTMCNLSVSIRETVMLFNERIMKKGLKTVINIDNDFPEEIFIDNFRFRQVLVNLLSNAVRFTTKGYVKIVAESNPLVENQSSTFFDISISIIDSGFGMTSQQQLFVKERLNHSKEVTTKDFEGAGLGLALAGRLVEQMHGYIDFSSQQGMGSVFVLHFDRIRGSRTKAQKLIAQEKTNQKNSTIIIITTDVERYKLITEKLSFLNTAFEGVFFYNNLDKISNFVPVFILLDSMLLETKNNKLANKISDYDFSNNTPLVFLGDISTSTTSITKYIKPGNVIHDFSNKDEVCYILNKLLPNNTLTYENQESPIDTPLYVSEDKYNFFHERLYKKWCEITNKQNMTDLEAFAQELAAFAQSSLIFDLKDYAEKLYMYSSDFDVEKVLSFMPYFEVLSRKIRIKE